MRIAFWSEQKEVGTAFNLAVIATATVCLHPLSAAVVSAGYHDSRLERKFFKEPENTFEMGEQKRGYGQTAMLAAETQDFFVSSGLECLLCKERREDLTERLVKANMREVIKDRMYCLPANTRKEQEWWYRDHQFARMERVMDAVESYFDVVFIDCGSRRDDYARKVIKEADVCVLNMRQGTEAIGAFYRNPPDVKGEVFFLLGKYFEDTLYNRRNLQRIYRIEEGRLGAIPYNCRLHAAEQTGRMDSGVRYYVGRDSRGKDAEFEKELVRTTNLILKLAGVIA